MKPLRTNADLYRYAKDLREEHAGSSRSLADWLGAFHGALVVHRADDGVSLTCFGDAIRRGWVDAPDLTDAGQWPIGLEVRAMVEDLAKAKAAGVLDDPYRFFGKGIPGGGYWYNWEPASFIECGLAGSVGGWQVGDSGRVLVPGDVATVDASGELVTVPAAELGSDLVETIETLSWDDVESFLWAGQNYE